jgi:hypothetical protein
MNRSIPSRLLPLVALSLALAACGGETSGAGVTFSARLAGASGAGALAASSSISLAGGRVQLEELWMVIRDVKLGLPGSPGEVSAGNGPFLLHLAGAGLDGGVVQEFSIEVPAGTYDDLRFIVHKLEDGEKIGVPELDGPRASIAMSLTVVTDGGADHLTFTSELNEAQRFARRIVVEEGSAPDNVTISIDPSGWFGDASGFLDPRDSANRQAIEDRIRTSIDAFEDDDHDGVSDDGPNHT